MNCYFSFLCQTFSFNVKTLLSQCADISLSFYITMEIVWMTIACKITYRLIAIRWERLNDYMY